jgi:hypothetical protein
MKKVKFRANNANIDWWGPHTIRAVPMVNLLWFLSLLITFTTHHFADVAQELMKREERKEGNDLYMNEHCLCSHRGTRKQVELHWGETTGFLPRPVGSTAPVRFLPPLVRRT